MLAANRVAWHLPSSLRPRPRLKPFFREQWRKRQVLLGDWDWDWEDSRGGNRFAKSQSSSFFSSCARCPSVGLRRNKIKCGEEKTPLVFGDIAIVIGGERGERGRRQKYANLSRKERKRVPSSPSIVPSRGLGRSLLAREIGGSKTETRFIKSTSKDAPNLFIEITADRGRERGREIKTLCSLPPSADRDCLLCRPLSLSLCISTL